MFVSQWIHTRQKLLSVMKLDEAESKIRNNDDNKYGYDVANANDHNEKMKREWYDIILMMLTIMRITMIIKITIMIIILIIIIMY